MSKKYIIIVLILLILVLVGGGYFWKTRTQQTATVEVNLTKSAQDVNPYNKTNPFSNIKVNPFE